MILDFVNRIKEQQELETSARKGGLLVVFGRRRVGKTRLLAHWLRSRGGMYSQAIEGPLDMQIQQVFADIRPQLSTQIVPKSWPEFLEVLTMQKKPWSLCLDEFPYLTAVDASLPSQLQKWLDHSMPRDCQLILAGSSTRMMNDLFLNRSAPLYGRAHKLLHVQPMDYAAFCDACALKPADMASFEKYSLVGGIPKYWEFVEKGHDVVALAEALYFDFAPYMEQEPQRILRDEGVTGASALSVLEAVGRGAERPSEIATRLGVVQTNLSRLLQQLLDASVLGRELPFGESMRTTKKVLYRIQDPTIRFWFRVYSPHQSLWRTFDAAQKQKLIHDHASTVFEDACRARYDGAARYWEKDVELDIVAKHPQNPTGVVAVEVKWRKLSAQERRNVMSQLQQKWARTALSQKYPIVRFEVMDAMDLLR
ncbi:MAG: ATP-binding protein [Verrucomicrobiaceae bacterium]